MAFLYGRRLTVAGAALVAAACAALVRVAVSEDLAPPARPRAVGEAPEEDARRRAADLVALARRAEAEGDVARALSRFRAAVALRPQLADRASPEFLGPAFEERLERWIAAMRKGTIAAPPAAFDDASYLLRRVYGGCG